MGQNGTKSATSMLQTRLINKDVGGTFVENINSAVEILIQSSNTLFILLGGAIMVLAMHAALPF